MEERCGTLLQQVSLTSVLPSEFFPLTRSMDSLAIESQLANLDFTAKTALYLNDDFFLTRVCPESLDGYVLAGV